MDKSAEIRKVLEHSGLLQGGDSELLTRIVAASRLYDLQKGAFLYRRGDRANRLFGLINGRISLQSTSIDGKELEVREVAPGEIFGAIEVFDFSFRERDAVALTDSNVFAWERVDILSCLESCPELCFGFIRYLCQNNRTQLTRFELLAMHPLPVQLAFQLVWLSQLDEAAASPSGPGLKLSQFDLARKVGVHRQSVNRQLRLWERQGWLRLGRGRIQVLDLNALRRLLPFDLSRQNENAAWFSPDEPTVAAISSSTSLPPEPGARQRATGILAIDAADYSRHLATDAVGTLARLRSGLAAIDRAVASGGGRIVAHLGDRVLAEFPTVDQAFRAALDLDKLAYGSGRGGKHHKSAMFRISVHHGTIQTGDGPVKGEAVNTAIQMTRVARGAGIVFSRQALDSLERPPKLDIHFLGNHELENVTDSVPIYSARPLPLAARASLRIKTFIPRRHRMTSLAAIAVGAGIVIWLAGQQSGSRQSLDAGWEQSVAVLPFRNLDGGATSDYYANGLAQEIRNLLAGIPSLKVTGASSSRLIGKDDLQVSEIGRALDVKTVLEGSLDTTGEQLTVTAQLLDVSTGSSVWTGQYRISPAEIFRLQKEVAGAVAKSLQMDLTDLPDRTPSTASTRAYASYLRARAAYNLFELQTAEALLRQAVAIDPGFAEAYELLAATYWRLAGDTIKASEGQRLMGEAATRALAIDPNLAFARALEKAGDVENWSWLSEVEALESAARQLPGHSELLNALSFDLLVLGYIDEAMRISRRSLSLDPLSLTAHNRHADALIAAGRVKEAKAILEHAAELGNPIAWWNLGILQLSQGLDESALEYFGKYWQDSGQEGDASIERLVSGTREPAIGQAFLEAFISQRLAATPEEDRYGQRLQLSRWYLYRGYLDPYFDLILDSIPESPGWADAETLIQFGVIYRARGFTGHPGYLEVARLAGFMDAWESRGAPDFCTRVRAQWKCE